MTHDVHWPDNATLFRYREERRKHFPSPGNVARKQTEAAEREARGEMDPQHGQRMLRLQEVYRFLPSPWGCAALLKFPHSINMVLRQCLAHSAAALHIFHRLGCMHDSHVHPPCKLSHLRSEPACRQQLLCLQLPIGCR